MKDDIKKKLSKIVIVYHIRYYGFGLCRKSAEVG